MRGPGAAVALLDAARRALEGQAARGGAGEARRVLELAAAAIAIAVRELDPGVARVERQLELLAGLYGEAEVHAAGIDAAARCASMLRRLARDIRLGTLDGACAPAVRLLLDEHLRASLAVSDPGALAELEAPAP